MARENKQNKENKENKTFCLILTRELWTFLKKTSVDKEVSCSSVINNCLLKYKMKCEKKIAKNNKDKNDGNK